MSSIRILIIGDVVGVPGCAMFQKHVSHLRKQYSVDAVIVNGENSSATGRGITPKIAHFFKHNGANVITTGNHIWANKEIYQYLNDHSDVLRPENFPSSCPGKGATTFIVNNVLIGVVNLQGRIFMREQVDCPFKTADSVLTYLRSKTNIIIVDFHAETTSEKMGLGYYLDGRVSAVVGTHTHVQTADERVLPGGTAFLTDLGMVGALNSMIGMKKEPIIEHFVTQMPQRFLVESTGPFVLSGALIEVDAQSGKALRIERIRIIDSELHVEQND